MLDPVYDSWTVCCTTLRMLLCAPFPASSAPVYLLMVLHITWGISNTSYHCDAFQRFASWFKFALVMEWTGLQLSKAAEMSGSPSREGQSSVMATGEEIKVLQSYFLELFPHPHSVGVMSQPDSCQPAWACQKFSVRVVGCFLWNL